MTQWLAAHGISGSLGLVIGIGLKHFWPQIIAAATKNEDLIVMRGLGVVKSELKKRNVPPQTITQIETGIINALTEAAKVIQSDETPKA